MDRLIEEVREKKPFSVLPEGSRSLATDLRSSLELGQKDLALNQLDRLAVSLGTTISVVSQEAEANRNWTVLSALLGVVGVIVTIVISIIVGQLNTNRLMRSVTKLMSARGYSMQGKKKWGNKNVKTQSGMHLARLSIFEVRLPPIPTCFNV